MKVRVIVSVLFILALLVPTVSAYTVTVEVKSVLSYPLEGVFIFLDDEEQITSTNGTTVFENVKAGNYSLRVVREGKITYSSVLVTNNDTKKSFTIMTGGDWTVISVLGLVAVVVVVGVFLVSKIKFDKRPRSRIHQGRRWGR